MDPGDLAWQGAAAEIAAWLLFLGGMLYLLWARRRSRRSEQMAQDGPEGEPYKVFTRAYDVELSHADIPWRLPELSPDRPAWYDKAGKWAAHRNYLERFDAGQPALEDVEQRLRDAVAAPSTLTACFLVDQSGSMQGAPVAATASALRIVVAALNRIGAATEILGFTTAGWHGGFARREWLRQGRPLRPGRLCALAHIVYKRADEAEWSPDSRDAFLHPDVLRENIDGEAIEWAAGRLAGLPGARKLLVVLSDGAPVDDSTLLQNGPSYLMRHVREVIARMETDRSIILAAVGIEHDVSAWYRNGRKAGVTSITDSLIDVIADLA